MKKNLLLTPGPTIIPEGVLDSLARPTIHHRTPQFQDYIKQVTEGLQYVFQTKNNVYMLVASGTGGLEAAVCNLLSPKDKAITVEGGKFGERWSELCQAYDVDANVIKVKWGKSVEAGQIKKLLDQDKSIKAVFITLCETSTGVTTDVKAIADVVKETDAVLVVDAVSGLGVTDCKTDEWSVDVVISASHKGFMLPPGIAFVSVSPKAEALIDKSTNRRYYFDLRKSKKALESTDTPFTPAINIVIGLTESLTLIKDQGLENCFAHFAKLARGTRAAAKALGLSLFADESCISNVLTAINLPEGLDGAKLVKTMRDEKGVTIAGGQAELKGKIVRIAHMGCVSEEDILAGLACFEETLKEMGHKFKENAGVEAAREVFHQQLDEVQS